MPDTRTSAPRPEGYVRGRATKKTIVASAAQAFAKQGFYGTSLRGIAAAAGVDHTTVIHHFGNKTNLLLAVIDWHDQQQLRTEFPTRLSAAALAEAFVRAAESNRDTPGLVQLLLTLTAEAGAEDHPARPALQLRHKRLAALFTWVIKRQRAKSGLADDGSTPAERAALVIATWDGLQLYDALHPGELDVPARVARLLREAFCLDANRPAT